MPSTSQGRRFAWLILAAFVGTRLVVFLLPPAVYRFDLGPYPGWAQKYHAANRAGVDFYTFHERSALEIAKRHAKGREVPIDSVRFEYPPLALALIVLPALPFEHLAAPDTTKEDFQPYIHAFRLMMLALDFVTLVFVWLLLRRTFPEESGGVHAERLLIYIGASAALGLLTYTRLDIAVPALIVPALYLLVRVRNCLGAFLLLALAVNLKLVPIILLPVFALGSLPGDWPRPGVSFVRAAVPLVGRGCLALALVFLVFLPFYLIGGERAYGFLAYHRERGLEVESVYAGFLMMLKAFGHTVWVDVGYGSYNLNSSLAPTLARVGTVLLALLLAAVALRLLLLVVRRPREREEAGRTLAQAHPQLFVGYSLALLLVLLAASKVLSPQYFLWVAPLAVLAPLSGNERRLWLAGVLALCALTTAVFPVFFWKHIAGIAPGTYVPTSPSWLGVLVVNARNALLVGMTIWMTWRMWRSRLFQSTGNP